nr:unnamed protein product [Spirometra erinaceieuropaei]
MDPANWEGFACDRPTWRRMVKTDKGIYEANLISSVEAKRDDRKSQLSPPHDANNQPPPTCPRCQQTFRTSIGVASASAVTAPVPAATALNPNTPRIVNLTAANTSDVDSVHTCPHCDRTFTPHIGLVGYLRIHRTETGEPVPEAPTYTRGTLLHCSHCTPAFTHRMGLLGHMHIHENLR